MLTPVLLALAMTQAPAASPPDLQVEATAPEPVLATGIQVVHIAAPAPLPPSAAGYPVVAGVAPTTNPCEWDTQCVYQHAQRGIVYGPWNNADWAMWSAQQAGLAEFYSSDGYRTGRQIAAERARAAGKPVRQDYGIVGATPPPRSVSGSSVSNGSVPTASGFSGGMYVGRSGSTGSSATPVQTGKPGGKI